MPLNEVQEHLVEQMQRIAKDASAGRAIDVTALIGLHAADLAEALTELSEDDRALLLGQFDTETRADILSHMTDIDESAVEDYLEDAPVEELIQVVDEIDPDDAADLLEVADQAKAEAVIKGLDSEHAADVRHLRTFDPDTAGGIMTTDFFWVYDTDTREQLAQRLKMEEDEIENAETILVCDRHMKLLGSVSASDFLTAAPAQTAGELMDRGLVNVLPGTDQEICARLMMKYDLSVLPVVDARNRVVGIITYDDIIDVVEDEADEDMFRMAGVGDDKPLEHGPVERAVKRLPWLAATLIGSGFVGPMIMHRYFEITLQHIVILAFFMPVIAGIGGNTATQCATITVRGLATGEIDFKDLFWMLRRELMVALILASVCALAVVGFAFGVMRFGFAGAASPAPLMHIAGTIGVSMFAGIMFSVVLGTTIPMLCDRFGVDPAVASGPFITTLIDIGTQAMYLGLATALLMP